MQAFFGLLALAVTGIAAWGLAESIVSTDSTASDFWQLVDDVQLRVGGWVDGRMRRAGQV